LTCEFKEIYKPEEVCAIPCKSEEPCNPKEMPC